MKVAHVLPHVIQIHNGTKELLCKVRLTEDGVWRHTTFRWFPIEFTYDDIESDVAGAFEVDRVYVQRVLLIEIEVVSPQMPE